MAKSQIRQPHDHDVPDDKDRIVTDDAAQEKTVDQDVPGLAARRLAVSVIDEVLRAKVALDETLERFVGESQADLSGHDRALARAIATVAFRHFGTISGAIDDRLSEGSPRNGGLFEPVMVAAAAQILYLDVPDHAAVDLAIRQLQEDRRSGRYAKLANAVLRRLAREREAVLAASHALADDTPGWLAESWVKAYGEETAQAIAAAHMLEPPLDLTVKQNAEQWAATLDAMLLPTGSLRLRSREALTDLPGYAEGAWWVQDAAAALPALLLRVQPGQRVADLCAAPGGKTAQLAALGGVVTAVDRSAPRLKRLRANLERLNLEAETRVADAGTLKAEPFDAVLLDAPCSATGTIRRHPDVAWTKNEADLAKLVALQARLLDHAANLVKPGGTLVYCTCSLQPEECELQIARLLAVRSDLKRDPVLDGEIGGIAGAITPEGDLRTLPHQIFGETARLSGWAGFYAARLIKL
jgi:16S rRNA (cytosine967-C5)-methyltransferase